MSRMVGVIQLARSTLALCLSAPASPRGCGVGVRGASAPVGECRSARLMRGYPAGPRALQAAESPAMAAPTMPGIPASCPVRMRLVMGVEGVPRSAWNRSGVRGSP